MSNDRSHLVPKKIVDKNGVVTTVHVNPNEAAPTKRSDIKPDKLKPKKTTSNVEEVYGDILSKIRSEDKTFHLHYVDRGEELSEEQAALFLKNPQELTEKFWSDYDFGHYSHEAAAYEAKVLLEEQGLTEEEYKSNEELYDDLIEEIMNRDTSDPVFDYARNTFALVRFSVVGEEGFPDTDEYQYHGDEDTRISATDNRVAFLAETLSSHLDAPVDIGDEKVRDILEEAVLNGPYYWDVDTILDLAAYDRVTRFNAIYGETKEPIDAENQYGSKHLEFEIEDPKFLLINPANGSGFEFTLPGYKFKGVATPSEEFYDNNEQLASPEKPSPFYTDEGAPGYSWQDIAGPVLSYYSSDMSKNWV